MAVSFAFIGFGEAGSEVSAGLLENGVERIQTYDILFDDPAERDRMVARADAIGVKACDSIAEAVAGVDIVFATVTCSACLVVAEEAAKHLNPQQYYLDFNSISPGKKRKVRDLIKPSGGAVCRRLCDGERARQSPGRTDVHRR